MTLAQLLYFKTVAELEHFTKASQQLSITQSNLSHAINDLENELSVSLFIRQGRNVRLTSCGALFLEDVTKVLDALEHAKNHLQDFINIDTGFINVGYISSLSDFVPFLISRFFEKTGKYQTQFHFHLLTPQELEKGLLAGTIDIAFTTYFTSPDIGSQHIGSYRTMLVVSKEHPIAAQDSVDLSTLKNETFITYSTQSQIHEHINNIFEKVGFQPKISFTAIYDSIILGAVSNNLGIALMPESSNFSNFNTKSLSITNNIPLRDVCVAWMNGRYMTPAVKNFRDFVLNSGLLLNEFQFLYNKNC